MAELSIERGFGNGCRAKMGLKNLVCAGIIGLAMVGCAREARAYPVTQLTYESSFEGQPAWSPDGAKIAFVTDRDGHKEIYIMDANGSNQTRLTYNQYDDVEPDWSPDGSKMVFSSDRSGSYDIYVMKADGDNQIRLTYEGSNERAPAWRYNEDKILYHDPYWDGTIYIINADGSSRTALGTGRWPSWSPDGTKIVFSSNEAGGTPQIYTMNHDGSDEQRLTFNGLINREPTWSPNGTKIVFSITKLDITPDNWTYFPDLYVMDSNGGNLERLTFDEYEYNISVWGILRRRPTWSPDGTKIAYHYKGDIWVMSGFPALAADLHHDGIVNLCDFAVLADCWLRDESLADIAPDGGDAVVDSLDLAKLNEEWLQTEEWYQP